MARQAGPPSPLTAIRKPVGQDLQAGCSPVVIRAIRRVAVIVPCQSVKALNLDCQLNEAANQVREDKSAALA